MPIPTLPIWYFTASRISFTLGFDAQHIIGPNIVPCFTTSSLVMLGVFPSGVSSAMVLYVLY